MLKEILSQNFCLYGTFIKRIRQIKACYHGYRFTMATKINTTSITLSTYQVLSEGEEGVKWELGFALFLTGKLGLAFLELGCLKVGMGNKILKWDWDT